MKLHNLVSVIVPVYNVEIYIKKCIDSIIHQTYYDIDIILVDDGSTDNSGLICDRYAETDRRITVIHKANGGHNSARKAGLAVSKGEYICFIDSDDWVEPNMIEEMAYNIISTGADFVHTGTILETINKTTVDCRFDECVVDEPRYNEKIWREIMAVDTENYINRGLARKLFKRELIEKCYAHTADDIAYGEDFVTIARCIIECQRISFIKKAYYHYNIREGSISRTVGIERIYMAVYQYEVLRKMFIQYNMYDYIKEILEKACIKEIVTQVNESDYSDVFIQTWLFDNIDAMHGKRIIIYGAGKVGYNYYLQFSKYADIEIVAWIDSEPEKYKYTERHVDNIDAITNIEFDYVVIAVMSESAAIEISHVLEENKIDSNKIIWKKPRNIF